MEKLYIIGNGFDIYHGLDTRYQSFAKYLAKIDIELYEMIVTYYELPDIVEDSVSDEAYNAWSTFELSLADLDYELVLEDYSDSMADPSSEDFRDRDWHTYQIDMELVMGKLTTRLISIFNDFILEVYYPDNVDNVKLKISLQSHFLNFNYTNTLVKYYGINDMKICYIHGKASDETCDIILGHGTEPSTFEEKSPEPPEGLNEEELNQWKEDMSEEYDYSYESAKQEILSYYERAFKNTSHIIDDNIDFFKNLVDVSDIYVLGHSISQVDIKYFENIKSNVSHHTKWHVTYYSDNEKKKHLESLVRIGINPDNIIQMKMTDIK